MTINKARTYIAYANDINVAPNGISQLRWYAIVKFIQKNFENN
jgi:hypothetical protein